MNITSKYKHFIHICLRIFPLILLQPSVAFSQSAPPGLIQTVQYSHQTNALFPIPFIPSESGPEKVFTDQVTKSGLSMFRWNATQQLWETLSYHVDTGWSGGGIRLQKAEPFLLKSHTSGDWKLSLTGHLSAQPLEQTIAPGLNLVAAPSPALSEVTAWNWDRMGTAGKSETDADKLYSAENNLMGWLRAVGLNNIWESKTFSGAKIHMQPGYAYWYLSQARNAFQAKETSDKRFDPAFRPAITEVTYDPAGQKVVLTVETDENNADAVSIYYQDVNFPEGVRDEGPWKLLSQKQTLNAGTTFQIEDAGSKDRSHPQTPSMRLYQVVNASGDLIAGSTPDQIVSTDQKPDTQTDGTALKAASQEAVSSEQYSTYTLTETTPQSDPAPMSMMLTFFTLNTTPLLETCGITTDYANANAMAVVEYKASASSIWKDAYPLIWDPQKSQFAGSIVNLQEETDYDVRVSFYVAGVLDAQEVAAFSTWTKTENLPILHEYAITDLYDPATDTRLKINTGGSAAGWIKIVGDGTTVIDAGYLYEDAVKIEEFKGYIILENLIIRGGKRNGINSFRSHHIRIINCDIAGWGRQPEATARSDGLWYEVGTNNVINKDSAIYLQQTGNVLVERCFIHDPRSTANSWQDGGGGTHPQGPNAFYSHGHHTSDVHKGQVVLRYNDFIGSDAKRWNDVIEGYYNGSSGGSFSRESDIYGNYLAFGNDDGAELDGGQTNVKFFKNKVEATICGVSVAPTMNGPSYIFKNLFVNLGGIRGKRNAAIKAGFDKPTSGGLPPFLAFNNTTYASIEGVGGTGKKYRGTTRNNIFHTWSTWSGAKYGIDDTYQDPLSDYDYDIIANSALSGGGVINAASGQEPNGFFTQVPVYVDSDAGNFQLAPGSVGIDEGQTIPNFSDGYTGSAPDIGAFEAGVDSMLPHRPIPQRVSRQQVNLEYNPGGDATTETVTINNPAASIGYTILRADGHDWIEVTPAAGTVPASGSFDISVSIDTAIAAQRTPFSYNVNAPDALVRGAFVIKFDNGFSIPVSVFGTENLNLVTDLSGEYFIENKNSVKVLMPFNSDLDNDNKVVQKALRTWWTSLRWDVQKVPGENYYYIKSQLSTTPDKVLRVRNDSMAIGEYVVMWDKENWDSQKWAFVDQGNGYYNIINKHSGRKLRPQGGATGDDVKIVQDNNGAISQQWRLISVP